MKPINVLLTGNGAPGAPGIIKCLRNNGERDVRIIGVDMNEYSSSFNLVDKFYKVPAARDNAFIDAILSICSKENVDVVLPIVTRELMKFSLNRDRFQQINTKVNVMEPDTLEIVNNKAKLLTEMKCLGLRTPKFYVIHTVQELVNACERLGYPEKAVCVKSAIGNGSRGVRIVDSSISKYDLFFNSKPNSLYISYDELVRTLSERDEMPEMLVMEYLGGTEYSVDILASVGQVEYAVSRRGISVVMSNMMSLEVDDNQSVLNLCKKTAEMLKMDGNFGFDLLYTADGEQPYIIECNPRLTGGVVACAAAGVNLPYLGVKRLLGEVLPELKIKHGTCMTRRYQESFFSADGIQLEW